MAYKTKNLRLKILGGVHSKNTRWGSGLLCLFVLCSGWRGSGGGGLAAPPLMPYVQALKY